MPSSAADAERKAMQRFVVLMRELDQETLPEGYFDQLRTAFLQGESFPRRAVLCWQPPVLGEPSPCATLLAIF